MTINRFYFFLIFVVIAISGNPAMDVLGKETIYIGTLIVFMILWMFKPLKLTRQDVLVFALFIVLALAHALSFGIIVVAASLGFLIKLGIALLSVRLIPDLSRKYVSVVYFLSCLSLIFYIPVQLGIDLAGILSPIKITLNNPEVIDIVIHNFHVPDERYRNCGMFWEPGAFAGYLILALFFLVCGDQRKAVLSKQGLVLIASLLSTQSTTGYLAFIVLAMFYAYNAGWVKSITIKLVVFPLMLVGFASIALVFFSQVSFLGEKINQQIESASSYEDASRINRFGNFLYDLEWIAKRPVLGWSATPETRFSVNQEVAELISVQGNGLTGFTVKFGLAGLLIFIILFAYATQRMTGSLSASLLGVVIVCVLLNGEQFLGFPVFLSLMFAPQRKSKVLLLSSTLAARKPKFVDKRTGYKT